MFKSKCSMCKKRKKYGLEFVFYRNRLFFKIKKSFVCYPCYSEA